MRVLIATTAGASAAGYDAARGLGHGDGLVSIAYSLSNISVIIFCAFAPAIFFRVMDSLPLELGSEIVGIQQAPQFFRNVVLRIWIAVQRRIGADLR